MATRTDYRNIPLTRALFTAIALLTFAASQAHAVSVNIPNFSFENPVTGGAIGEIDDWTDPNGCCDGVFVSPGFGQGAAPTDGNQIAFNNADIGQIFQTLVDTYQANTGYELSVDVSARAGPAGTDMVMVLYEGVISDFADLNAGNIVAQRTLTGADGVVADQFNTFSLTAVAADVATAAAAGQSIGIGFFGAGGGTTGNSDFDLDNVRLEATAANVVPEPATFSLAALGLLSLGVVGWRRRRR